MKRRMLLLLLGLMTLPATSMVRTAWGQGIGDDGSEIEVAKDPEAEAEAKRKAKASRPRRDPNLPLSKQVELAIKEGVEWLKKAQRKDGSWGPVVQNVAVGVDLKNAERPTEERSTDETGPTAFALYTLAKCGVKKSDKTFKKGLKWLKDQTMVTFDMTGNKHKDNLGRPTKAPLRNLTTYEHAVIVMLIEAMNPHGAKRRKRPLSTDNPLQRPRGSKIPKDEWKWMHDRVLALTVGRRVGKKGRGESTIRGHQRKTGGWRYWESRNPGEDLSSTQFALLGLRAASQAGYPVSRVSPKTWSSAADYVRKLQRPSGGFRYGHTGGPEATGSMTACGIVSLVICREQLERNKQAPPDWIEPVLKKAIVAFTGLYQPAQNSREGGGDVWHNYYYMYGVERTGGILGRKEFGGADWYLRGATHLVGAQQQDGKWVDESAVKPRDVLGTCYALLFLKRATRPAAVAER